MLGYIFERLIKPVSEGGAAVASDLWIESMEGAERSEAGEHHESLEEELEAEANASYGDELFHGRRMGGLSAMKFEGDGSVRGLRNAVVSLGYVVPLGMVDAAEETAQERAIRMWQADADDERTGLAPDELTGTLEGDEASPSAPILSPSVSRLIEGDVEERRPTAAGPSPDGADGLAPTLGPDQAAGDLPDAVLSISESSSPAPQWFTTVAASNLVVGPASAPELAEIALFLAEDAPEVFEFYAPQERPEATVADGEPPQDDAMVELLMAEVMREIHDEHEAFELADEPGHGAQLDDHAQGHFADHADIA